MFNQIVIGLIAGYIFVCTIPYTPAARYIILCALLAISATGALQKRFSYPPKSLVVVSLSLFVAISFISAVDSPYLIDSLQGFRKEYLPPLVVLLIASSIKQTPNERLHAATIFAWALLSGFVAKTILALWDGAINHPFIFSPYSNLEFVQKNGLPRYVSYYAVESTLYLSLAYSALLFLAKGWASRSVLALTLITSLGILLASGIRSAFAAAILGLSIISLAKLRTPRRVMGFSVFAIAVGASALYLGKGSTELTRYIELVKVERYSSQEGMSGRYPIWEGVSELVAQRPALGFGPGWQKIPLAAKDNGLITQWQSESSPYAQFKHQYFSLEQGQVNPHNLVMQVLFETGWLGLTAYIFMLGTFFWSAFTAGKKEQIELAQWLKVTILGYGAAFLVIDITNAFLLHNTMVALMIITTLIWQANTRCDSRHGNNP